MPEEIAETLVNKWFSEDAYDLFDASSTIQAELAAALRDAYERAAEVAEACNDVHPGRTPHVIAARIRALKGETA